ncbi:MAG: glycosyl transferase [Hydrogenophaga sp.]|nr:glycosyl transferase [Hydrogenophaga sp.]
MPERLVYLSPVQWDSFAQRPHKFVQWWHGATGGEVIWVNPYPARLPRWTDLARLRQAPALVGEAIPAWLQVLHVSPWPLEPLPLTSALLTRLWQPVLQRIEDFAQMPGTSLVIGKPSRMALHVARSGWFASKTYDAMDDFPAFHQGRAGRVMAGVEQHIVAHMDSVITSSSALAAKFNVLHPRVVKILNGLDPAAVPGHLFARRPTTPPVLGYVGTIREWFDWALVTQVAEAVPAVQVRLIGPLDHPCPHPLPSNVECLPACSHGAAIEHMAGFSAGLIPFRVNRLTRAVDPIKYYEYAALGLPVLSTAFGEMETRSSAEGVFHIARDEDALPALMAALSWQIGGHAVRNFRLNNSWAARFGSAGLLHGSLSQQATVAPEGI